MARKKLQHERNMKLDAFQRVDDLQAVVCDGNFYIPPFRILVQEQYIVLPVSTLH